MRIWEQVDAGRDRPTYSWMVSRSYATRGEMLPLGFLWIAGRRCRGVFVTSDWRVIERFRGRMAACGATVTIESNGTHARLGLPMHEDSGVITAADAL
jgi:hypothetical protein